MAAINVVTEVDGSLFRVCAPAKFSCEEGHRTLACF